MKKLAIHLQGARKQIPKFTGITVVLCLLLLLSTNNVWAKSYSILIVSSGSSPAYSKIINTIQSAVSSSAALSKTNTATTFSALFIQKELTTQQLQNSAKDQDLIVTIGQQAMIAITQIHDSPPILSTLIPKQSREKYRAAINSAAKKNTAVFIDNPPERQILLAKILLGNFQRLGILVSTNSIYNKTTIENSVKKTGLKSRIETVADDDNLISKLSLVLSASDAFLALPDAKIFNRDTAKNILLTTYRHRTPVIAYSASYVKAGALAAVYTTPQQIAQQTSRILINILQSNLSFPQHDSYPEEFEVIVNQNVSKSLGIPTRDENIIKHQLLKALKENK
jgi:ABC-type uncharacterized transport system substrate-binding protein